MAMLEPIAHHMGSTLWALIFTRIAVGYMGGFAKGLWDWVERCVDFGASTWI
jgi:hypothetical protein